MQQPDYDKPVAYTPEGQPLYTHPSKTSDALSGTSPSDASPTPQVVYLTRAIDPHRQVISPEIQQKHDASVKKYPQLNLSDGEYVISAVKRHPIGLISIWVVVLLCVLVVMAMPAIIVAANALPFAFSSASVTNGLIVLVLLIVTFILGGFVATVVYDANRFYLTNESVTQHIQTSLFAKKSQTISLGNVEDASYRQRGILQTMLNYGSIRLSTEGEETTYKFNFVADPQEQIRLLNDAVEAFKNFRPISHE